MERNIKDASQEQGLALPAANATATTASLDLGLNPGRIENVEVEVSVDATTTLVDTKDIDVTLQESDDNSTFTDVAGITLKVTGVSGNGNDEAKAQVRPSRATKRYVRASVAVESGAGDVTAAKAHIRLLF